MSKIYHLDDLEEFYGGVEWKVNIDVTNIWNKYSNKQLSLVDFNKLYRQRLIEYKTEILQLGNDVWNELVPILNKMTESKNQNELYNIYDDIYSWGDKHDVQIKTK